jgi:hypothetical protein
MEKHNFTRGVRLNVLYKVIIYAPYILHVVYNNDSNIILFSENRVKKTMWYILKVFIQNNATYRVVMFWTPFYAEMVQDTTMFTRKAEHTKTWLKESQINIERQVCDKKQRETLISLRQTQNTKYKTSNTEPHQKLPVNPCTPGRKAGIQLF